MRILLTGASGFIGGAVARLALARGHAVAGLTRRPPAVAPGSEIAWLHGSLQEPPWPQIAEFAPEACIHAAWLDDPGSGYDAPENDDYARWSLGFLEQVLRMGTARLLGVGTCVEYRAGAENLAEDRTPLEPASRYARAKHRLHLALREAVGWTPGARLCWARPFYVYGVGEPARKLCSSLVRQLARGEPLTLRTPGSVKDYVHVNDVATALLLSVEAGFNGALNVGTGEGIAVEALAREICRRLGRPEDLIRLPATPPDEPPDRIVADAARLRGLGWRPDYSLDAGLDELVAWHSRQDA